VAEAARDPAVGRLAVSGVTRQGALSLIIITEKFGMDLTRLTDRVGALGGTIRRRLAEDGQAELEVTIPCGS
jgi:hypothetical protein